MMETVICQSCGEKIYALEAQTCTICGQEDLGDCCINDDDHDCWEGESP